MTAASFPARCACGKPARAGRTQCTACESRARRAASRLGCRVCGSPTLRKRVHCAEHRVIAVHPKPRTVQPGAPCATEGCPNVRRPDKRHCGPCVYQRALERRALGMASRACAPFVCACGVPAAEHIKCGACGLLAGDEARHLIPVADLQEWDGERDLCERCRLYRQVFGRRAA